jgi:hypothetical protein
MSEHGELAGGWCMFVVAAVIECNLVVQVQRRFMDEFHVDRIPSFDITLKWVDFLWNTSSVCDHFVGSSPPVYTAGSARMIKEAAINSPSHFAGHQSTAFKFFRQFL